MLTPPRSPSAVAPGCKHEPCVAQRGASSSGRNRNVAVPDGAAHGSFALEHHILVKVKKKSRSLEPFRNIGARIVPCLDYKMPLKYP